MSPPITILTDFGLRDGYLAQVKGVLLGIAPDSPLVDISHLIPPQDIRCAARMLRQVVSCFPPATVHLAVVDPGVGTDRRIVAVELAGQRFVLPDNGLLTYLLQDFQIDAAVVVDRRDLWRQPVSSTFHGRDIMAPVAAHWAAGSPLCDLGSALDLAAREFVILPEIPPGAMQLLPNRPADAACAQIVEIDHFGNASLAGSIGNGRGGQQLHLKIGDAVRPLQVVETYGEAQSGELVMLKGSQGCLELAIVNGSAARELSLSVGDWLEFGVSEN
ncbi:SAM hydrolase/SAM-dependent halogenase family protein [Aureliella helgolandensis]|uniref:Adenosyl-chloride synthase n=1 Tax=Aureliella helgolandensis TaxID=2527968 RepID=A0A518GH65_9BACT|nr:SAM-dependent chlorinase/fluorinase [Aureliella helgolandensis]QDV27920.1 Adenosyl-chloride synthase [Aureliella helgolandensis]